MLSVAREHRIFIVALDHLFLAPVIEPSVVVQRHHTRHGEFGVLGKQQIGSQFEVRRGVELEIFLNVVAAVNALNNVRLRLKSLGAVQEQVKNFCTDLSFPGLKIGGFRPQESHALRRFFLRLLDEGIEAAERRPFPFQILAGVNPGQHSGHGIFAVCLGRSSQSVGR